MTQLMYINDEMRKIRHRSTSPVSPHVSIYKTQRKLLLVKMRHSSARKDNPTRQSTKESEVFRVRKTCY